MVYIIVTYVSLPEWERKTTEEANGGKLAESQGWASKTMALAIETSSLW